MKTLTLGFLAAVVVGTGTLAAQTQSSGESDSLKRLRQIIAEQKQNPDKVIRDINTNPPPAEATNAASGQKGAPTTGPASRPPLEFKPAPPPEPPTGKKAAAAELERQFLNGKLSERKYKKALAELDNPSNPPASQTKTKPAPSTATTLPTTTATTPAPTTTATTPAPTTAATPPTTAVTPSKPPPGQSVVTPTTPPQPAANQKSVSEVEARIDEMIRQKEARERAAKTTNAPPAAGVKSTKRERLDFLLRQVVDGKLSDAEYKKEREKILAEPE